jgi:predicted neuraminidase
VGEKPVRKTFSAPGAFAGITALFLVLDSFFFTAPSQSQTGFHSRFIFPADSVKHGHAHGSSLVQCPNGDLLACWYEGRTDRSSDVHIQAARMAKGERAWGESFLLADTPTLSDNNPCLFVDQEKRLWLFYYTLLGSPEQAWETAFLRYKISSRYEQRSQPIVWECQADLPVQVPELTEAVARLCQQSELIGADAAKICSQLEQQLTNQLARRLGWTTRCQPLLLRSGELLLPMASEIFGLATMAITADRGRSWFFSRPPLGYGIEQPTVFEKDNGDLIALFRDASSRHRIRRSDSHDCGRTWSPVVDTNLPNPGSGLQVLRLASGNLALIYNDVDHDPRSRLAVSLSPDQGETWPWSRYVENDDHGRYDYPCLIQTEDGRLQATYSYNVKTIKQVVFSEEWIKNLP